MEEKVIMRVLFLIDTNVGGKGGAETHLWNLLSKIDQSLYSVDVIYFDTDEMDSKVINSGKGRIQGVNYYRIPVRRVYSPSSFKHIKNIYKMMKAGNYDCAISFFETSDVLLASLGSLAGIKMRISNRRDTGFRNSKKLALAYRIINKFFTGFIAVSEAVKKSIIVQGVEPGKIKVIYNAVDINRFESLNGEKIRLETGILPDEIVFGLIANLNPVKNHISIIEALADLHKQEKYAHLILVGDGELRKELELKVVNLNLSKYVHFLGGRSDIENILGSIDVFVLASHTEGLSNALLEAMASRKAVIASRVGGNIEVVENGVDGLLVSTESSSIADAMKMLFDSRELRDEMGENAFRHIIRQFSLEQMLTYYENIMRRSDAEAGLKVQATRSVP